MAVQAPYANARKAGDYRQYPPHNGRATSTRGKRAYDLVFSIIGLILLGPVLLLIAALIKLFDGGKIFYRQSRVGLHGAEFQIWKFRTMTAIAEATGPAVTRGGDNRVTALGRLLRKIKLDELPQLWNVLKGEMSLVGPRPEVPRYVKSYTPVQRQILNYKPGITDLATLFFRNEESLLCHAKDVERFYVQHCLGRKVDFNLHYAQRANLFSDTWIILQTVLPSSLGILFIYAAILLASLWMSFSLAIGGVGFGNNTIAFAAVVTVQLAALAWRNQLKGLLGYFSLPELRETSIALSLSFMVLLGIIVALPSPPLPSANILAIDLILSLVLLTAFRTAIRLWRERGVASISASQVQPARVGIIGAGETGAQLAREILSRKDLGRSVSAFFDDNVRKWHRRLHEIPIVGMPECLLEGWEGKLDEIIIAAPDTRPDRLLEIRRLVQGAGFKCSICQSLQHGQSRET